MKAIPQPEQGTQLHVRKWLIAKPKEHLGLHFNWDFKKCCVSIKETDMQDKI